MLEPSSFDVADLTALKKGTGNTTLDFMPNIWSWQLNNKNKGYRVATYNVRSLHQAGKMVNLMKEMQRLNIDISSLSKVRWPKNRKKSEWKI